MLRARYRRIVLFFARVAASLIVWELILPRLGLRKWVQRTRSDWRLRLADGDPNQFVLYHRETPVENHGLNL